jgi:beta-lactamase regulating signal transducer with metallopeptidase domain
MRPSRRVLASIISIGFALAGCDTISAKAVSPEPVGSALHDIALVVVLLGLATLATIVVSIARQAVVHRQLSDRLRAVGRPAVIGGRPIALVPGPGIALVAGLRRPRTYVSADVVAALTEVEVTAVVAHERHHELRRAPARLIILDGIAGALAYLPLVPAWVERARARIETDADAHALNAGSSRQAIARAILKLAAPPGATAAAAFVSATDVRLRVLLGEESPKPIGWAEDAGLAVALGAAIVVLCFALAH